MLKDTPAMITFSVDDPDKARQFYGEVLGLELDTSTPGMLGLKLAGGTTVMIYAKATHKPASYTLLNFTVEDLEKTMAELTAKGVKFEHYDDPDTKTDGHGVVDYGMMKIAFFNDPAGNNHGIMQMTGPSS
jgi:catechol 2,3-dioxygenase-like lactoylglutathione lyase family enzyme